MNFIKTFINMIKIRIATKQVYEYEYVQYYGRTPKEDARLRIKRKIYRQYAKITNMFKRHGNVEKSEK